MKTNSKLALATAFVIALAGLSARAQSDEPSAPRNFPPGPPHIRFGQALKDVLQKYDANHNGQLDQSEMAALQKDIADGKIQPPGPPPGRAQRGHGGPPGQISRQSPGQRNWARNRGFDRGERGPLHGGIQDDQLPPPRFGAGPRGPRGPGFGQRPTAQQLLNRFDANNDGKLDAKELTAFLNTPPPRLARVPRVPPPPAGDALPPE